MNIIASSTICHQPTFRKLGFSSELSELSPTSQLISPDYAEIIPAMDRRRMSEVLKMSIACSMECLEQAGLSQPDAIIVGTSMGCCSHTKFFLNKIASANGGLISPTSFILSTHNTIAGQLSLHLRNHGYNMTHTQNSLSFEHALIDGMLCEKDGFSNILIGAGDELESGMYNMNVKLNEESIILTSGASFFILSTEVVNIPSINLIDVGSYGLIPGIASVILDFLKSNEFAVENIDLILYSSSNQKTREQLSLIFKPESLFDYQSFCGTWFTNSSFAMSYGVDILLQGAHPMFGEHIRTVLICNNLVTENLGLILLKA